MSWRGRNLPVVSPGDPAPRTVTAVLLDAVRVLAALLTSASVAGAPLRAALNPLSELNPQGEPQAFSVVLKDAHNGQARVVVSDLPFPPGERKPSEFFKGDSFNGHVHMKTIILPLADFPGIDPAKNTEIALTFDQRDSGELFMADLALIR